MFTFIRQWMDNRVINKSDIKPAEWSNAIQSLPILHGLSETETQRLIQTATLFLHRKSIEAVKGLTVTRHMSQLIALQACLPILNLGIDSYNGWYSVVIYPAGFTASRTVIDEQGIEHSGHQALAGESWSNGAVILSWDDAKHAGVIDGHNLIVHEFAHKLDMQNGAANGYPPLHSDMIRQDWVDAWSSGFDHFRDQCEHHHTKIDCYGATSPAEFFAVMSEVFFERPQMIEQHYPAIYQQLKYYYRQDPLTRLRAI